MAVIAFAGCDKAPRRHPTHVHPAALRPVPHHPAVPQCAKAAALCAKGKAWYFCSGSTPEAFAEGGSAGLLDCDAMQWAILKMRGKMDLVSHLEGR